MKKIKIYLEYQCFPMWVYNESGELLDNDLAEELKGHEKIDYLLVEIQNIYDSLFEDNSVKFEYKGFDQEDEKNEFNRKIEDAISMIEAIVGDKYLIEKQVDI